MEVSIDSNSKNLSTHDICSEDPGPREMEIIVIPVADFKTITMHAENTMHKGLKLNLKGNPKD